MLETLPQQVNRALEIRMGDIKLLASVPKKKKKKWCHQRRNALWSD